MRTAAIGREIGYLEVEALRTAYGVSIIVPGIKRTRRCSAC